MYINVSLSILGQSKDPRTGRFGSTGIDPKIQKGIPPQTPSFLKNSLINRVTKVSSTFGPTESDSEKKLGGYLDSRRGNWI